MLSSTLYYICLILYVIYTYVFAIIYLYRWAKFKMYSLLFAVKQNEIKKSTIYNAMDSVYTDKVFWQ